MNADKEGIRVGIELFMPTSNLIISSLLPICVNPRSSAVNNPN
jgi:hypothetical protein